MKQMGPCTVAAIAFGISMSPATGAELKPYPNANDIAPPVTLIEKYAPVLDSSMGPAIDPEKGYAVEDLGSGAFFVTEGVYQVMFVRTDDGLILVDAPPNIGEKLLAAAEEIAPGVPITHLIYSHPHVDHIGFASAIIEAFPDAEIVAHQETADNLARAQDTRRPAPSTTFDSTGEVFALSASGQTLNLRYPGPNHQAGNIEIWHADSQTLMLVDVVFPGWMMWRRLALAEDIPGTFDVIRDINDRYDFETLIAGHVGRTGTKADVEMQIEFMTDLHNAAGTALGSVTPGEGVDPADFVNPWGVFDNYIDRVVVECVNALTPKWQDKMSGFDVFIYDQCLAMEQSIRVDGPSL
jgi:glyoxylase-like metal-dependent hydrolase (beta-lactamase superfamily II)